MLRKTDTAASITTFGMVNGNLVADVNAYARRKVRIRYSVDWIC